MGFSGTPNNEDPIMVSFPNYSHTTPIRIPKDMGIVWEAYHKGVPLVGFPENPIEWWFSGKWLVFEKELHFFEDTPLKINMEPKNWRFVDVFPFSRKHVQVPC